MLPVDEDILITRYGGDPDAAEIYRRWREAGASPQDAIQIVVSIQALNNAFGAPMLESVQSLIEEANRFVALLRKHRDSP